MKLEQRYALMVEFERNACTIEGRPAMVCGAHLDFPVVVSKDGKIRAEYSWSALQRRAERKMFNMGA